MDEAGVRVGFADFSIGLFQFDSADGLSVDEAPGAPAVPWAEGVAATLGSGATLWTGTGTGAAGGAGGGGGVCVGTAGCPVPGGSGDGFGSGFRWMSGVPGSPGPWAGVLWQDAAQVAVGSAVGDSEVTAAAADRPIEIARTAAPAAAEAARSTDEGRVMATFFDGARPPPQ